LNVVSAFLPPEARSLGLTPITWLKPAREGSCVPYWRLFYHLVWATKERDPKITAEIEPVVERSLNSTLDAMHCLRHAIGFMPDHVHVAVSIPPSLAISDVVARLKGASARAVNLAYPAISFAWQGDYGALSFGERSLHDVVAYVLNQKERHATGKLWPSIETANDA
jgi:putative transposase